MLPNSGNLAHLESLKAQKDMASLGQVRAILLPVGVIGGGPPPFLSLGMRHKKTGDDQELSFCV